MPELTETAPAVLHPRREDRHRPSVGVRPLRLISFLAPNMLPVYQFIARRLEARLGLPIEVAVGLDYEELQTADLAFVCSLIYVELEERGEAAVEPLAAPVLQGERYRDQPIYFSDVIVRQDSPYRTFADLRGCSWAYNEPHSQSGYGITRFRLVQMGETCGYFGRVVEAGWHETALRLVHDGEVAASAIDSQVLEVALREQPELAENLRIIDSLGPSSIQPLVAARRLPDALKADVQAALLELEHDPSAKPALARGCIQRFATVNDGTYDDIRAMRRAAERANFLQLR